jgi:hypothetical protein
MRKILYFLLIPAIFTACDVVNSDLESEFVFESFVGTSASQLAVAENDPSGSAAIGFILTGPAQTTDIVIELAVTTTGDISGVTLPAGTSVTIPAGEFTASYTVAFTDNGLPDGDKTISVAIVSASGASVATEDTERTSVNLLIADDDCDIPSLVGRFSVVTTATNPAGCDGVENTVEISLVEDLGDFKYTYQLTDVTGGLYLNCYGASGDNPGQISTDVFGITMVDQPDVVYGGDVFNGSGSLDCDGNLVIEWSNGYGDAGTSTFTQL